MCVLCPPRSAYLSNPASVSPGQETAGNARVWKIYRDRMSESDEIKINGWNKTLDTILIFVRDLLF